LKGKILQYIQFISLKNLTL